MLELNKLLLEQCIEFFSVHIDLVGCFVHEQQ
ncbi:MAG: hypothetical protein QOH33_1333, partial [Paraburkholderia sp.]|nr:hypothetical protein [Paraburkholderia sp.]